MKFKVGDVVRYNGTPPEGRRDLVMVNRIGEILTVEEINEKGPFYYRAQEFNFHECELDLAESKPLRKLEWV